MAASTTADELQPRELVEDVACAHAGELAAVVPTLNAALAWPAKSKGQPDADARRQRAR
jgi:hypothetical protein